MKGHFDLGVMQEMEAHPAYPFVITTRSRMNVPGLTFLKELTIVIPPKAGSQEEYPMPVFSGMTK